MNMSLLSGLFLFALSVNNLFGETPQLRTGWNGIVPLRSTRAEVNRLLGKPEGECECIYRSCTERITVDYAEAHCSGPVDGWNVPRDTVLQIKVTPLAPKTFSELALDESSYIKTREQDTATVFYTDLQRGIRYSVQDNHVVTLHYTPLRSDNELRCAGFPAYDGGIADYRPYDSFPAGSNKQTYSHLDEFAFQLTIRSDFNGYIVSYAGRISERGEAKKMAESARGYLINTRRVPPDRVFAIDGGFREKSEFELYLIAKGLPAPTPKPTLPPGKLSFGRLPNGHSKKAKTNEEDGHERNY